MKRWIGVGLVLCFCALPSLSWAKPRVVNVAFVPHSAGEGDVVEQSMFALMGQEAKNLDFLWAVNTKKELYDRLRMLKEKGYQVDKMIIAGHGPGKGGAGHPHITLGKQYIDNHDVDVPKMNADLKKFQDYLKKFKPDDPRRKRALKNIDKISRKLNVLNSFAGLMKKDGELKLINCNPARTGEGRTFCTNLGKLLMGKNGGKVIASKTAVDVDQVKSVGGILKVWWKTGEWVSIGDFIAMGEWMTFDIPPGSAVEKPIGLSVVFLMDGSGSMRGNKLSEAKAAIRQTVAANLQPDSGAEMALLVFAGCGSCRVVQGFTNSPGAILAKLDGVGAGGDTPIEYSLYKARDYLRKRGTEIKAGDPHSNWKGKIILLSDGGESCNGDPVEAAKTIHTSTSAVAP
jgi:hypothetical protein